MKRILLIVATFTVAITALHAQVPATPPPIDPAVQAAVNAPINPAVQAAIDAFVPHAYAGVAGLGLVIFLFLSRVFQGRKNKLSWLDAIAAAVNGTNVPSKLPLILGACCMLTMTSCAGLVAAITSPPGQLFIVTAEAMGKQLANAEEEKIVEQVILKSQAQIAVLNAQGVNTNTAKEILRQSELLGLAGVVTAAQHQYTGMTGHAYVLPKDPLVAASLPVVSTANPPTAAAATTGN